ncbi:MAG TPA: hypothetical protein VF546_10575 [Pyrinomonadaceae bacterium]|jgi:hypothetical protein
MTTNGKILSVGLAAALLGGTVVGLVNNRRATDPSTTAATQSLNTTDAARMNAQRLDSTQPTAEQVARNNTTDDSVSADYRAGFADGFNAARNGDAAIPTQTTVVREVPTSSRVVYRNAPARTRYARASAPRRAYYDYQPRKRSFWSKHRDKLTVAMGTGGGALLGGLIGGKKGALIGGLAGAGGSALYTYKIRNRNNR